MAKQHALAMAVGSAILLIRELCPTEDDRLDIAKAYGDLMVKMVNEPGWPAENEPKTGFGTDELRGNGK